MSQSSISRRRFLRTVGAAGLTAAALPGRVRAASAEPITVGILHSLSGTMAISEVSLKDVELMAIDEINAAGGIMGRKVVPVIEDGASDWPNFAEKAKKLIQVDKVCSVFGCWTSASRKAVKPVFEQLNGLLWYPVQFEGNECSKNIFYTGATPNQQIIPSIQWLMKNRGKRFFLLGSDYVFPRTANRIIKTQLEAEGGEMLAEEYTPLGHVDYATVINKIKAAKPDAILSTINGDSNVAFYKQLRDAGVTAKDCVVMAYSVAEDELRGIGGAVAEGHMAAWNYFMTTRTTANPKFIESFKKKYGANRVTSDPIEAAYFQVHLWAKAVAKAGSTDVDKIRTAALGQEFDAPGGKVKIDDKNQHTWKTVRLGVIRKDGQFDEAWNSGGPVRPDPYQYVAKKSCDWTRGGEVAI